MFAVANTPKPGFAGRSQRGVAPDCLTSQSARIMMPVGGASRQSRRRLAKIRCRASTDASRATNFLQRTTSEPGTQLSSQVCFKTHHARMWYVTGSFGPRHSPTQQMTASRWCHCTSSPGTKTGTRERSPCHRLLRSESNHFTKHLFSLYCTTTPTHATVPVRW